MTFYAHTNDQSSSGWQPLREHLLNTSQLALELGENSRLAQFAAIAALFHDLGKYSHNFQNKLLGANLRVDHSTAGAQEIYKLFSSTPNQNVIAILLAYCIAGHHSGLPDHGSNLDVGEAKTLVGRLKREVPPYFDYAQEMDLRSIDFPETLPIKPNRKDPGFSVAFFTRMVYSLLVDADYQETEAFMSGSKKPRGDFEQIASLCDKFNQYISKFDHPKNPIDRKRTETLQECIAAAAAYQQGYFSLTVPTGGGKTLSSMAFALNHASKHGLKRIIYVIPYTSIIEQNAAVFKACLGEQNVLEHHSNFDWEQRLRNSPLEDQDDQTNHALGKLKLAAENWDIPIIVTTNVQFFESLFANRSSRCRKLHNIANSVIIFDETQMLPREYLEPCMLAINELVGNYGASVVFCTATQPSLDQFLPTGAPVTELVSDPRSLYSFYKRVSVKPIGRATDEELLKTINQHRQVLCIVNTRKHAKGLFQGIDPNDRFHLSTLMCPAHRQAVISGIKTRLIRGQICRVISTQIMEAGIDVDFPIGYRAISGLDSIIQASGRVNREGRRPISELFVFEPVSTYVKRSPAYIQQGAEVASRILRDYHEDPSSLQAIQAYFDTLNGLQDAQYFDTKGILDYFRKGVFKFDFETAGKNFRLIENDTQPVVICYDENVQGILNDVRRSQYPASYSRKLQRYTVNIYDQEFQALQEQGLIDVYNETYAVLNDNTYYDRETGLTIPNWSPGSAIFFDG